MTTILSILSLTIWFLNKNIEQFMPLLALLESIGKNVDNVDIGCGIFVDIQKAFDTVEHDILL